MPAEFKPHQQVDPKWEPSTPFEATNFVASIHDMKRTKFGGVSVTLIVQPDFAEDAMKMWQSNTPLSFNVEVWHPFAPVIWNSHETG